MPNEKKLYSYFMDKIFPQLVTLGFGAIGALITIYFTVSTLSNRVNALEDTTVRKDVLSETIKPMQQDIGTMKSDVGDIKTDIGTIKGYIEATKN